MKTLIVACARDWIGIARMPQALRQAGFTVRAVSPSGAYLSRSSHLEKAYEYAGPAAGNDHAVFLQRILDEWAADLLIPGDDVAVQFLHVLWQLSEKSPLNARARELIERSLGTPALFEEVDKKSLLSKFAAASGTLFPPQVVCPSLKEAQDFVAQHGFPVIHKTDFTFGGQGVHICAHEAELFDLLKQPSLTNSDLQRRPATFTLQKCLIGKTLGVSLTAHQGKTLSAFSYAKERTNPPRVGPTSVARPIDRPDLLETARRLVDYFQYTGFGGLDFLDDETNQMTYLLEFNPRPTPTCHLGQLLSADLCGALHAALSGTPMPAVQPHELPPLIALFPNEWLRDQKSPYLHTAYHDVPWDDPSLLLHIINGVIRISAKKK